MTKKKKLTKLTEAHHKLMAEVREEWLGYGLSCEPADRSRAETAIRDMYQQAGFKHPEIVWCGSPPENCIRHAGLVHKIKLPAQTENITELIELIRKHKKCSQLVETIRNNVWRHIYGQHDAPWLAFYDFFRRCGYEEETERLGPLWELAKSGGWALPYEHVCWVSERTSAVHLDDQNRAHNPDGPAIAYPDGFKVYAWHGILVTEQIIEHPHTLSAKKITEESNIEIRRIMLERYGLDNYIAAIGAQCVQKDDFGELYRASIPQDEDLVMVRVWNSTPEPDGSYKEAWLRVNPNVQSAHEAVAASFEESVDDYKPLLET